MSTILALRKQIRGSSAPANEFSRFWSLCVQLLRVALLYGCVPYG